MPPHLSHIVATFSVKNTQCFVNCGTSERLGDRAAALSNVLTGLAQVSGRPVDGFSRLPLGGSARNLKSDDRFSAASLKEM